MRGFKPTSLALALLLLLLALGCARGSGSVAVAVDVDVDGDGDEIAFKFYTSSKCEKSFDPRTDVLVSGEKLCVHAWAKEDGVKIGLAYVEIAVDANVSQRALLHDPHSIVSGKHPVVERNFNLHRTADDRVMYSIVSDIADGLRWTPIMGYYTEKMGRDLLGSEVKEVALGYHVGGQVRRVAAARALLQTDDDSCVYMSCPGGTSPPQQYPCSQHGQGQGYGYGVSCYPSRHAHGCSQSYYGCGTNCDDWWVWVFFFVFVFCFVGFFVVAISYAADYTSPAYCNTCHHPQSHCICHAPKASHARY